MLINHVAILVIDEIERVANDSKRGETLINYRTQLVNQSNVAICFVGNESANKYFETKEYMGRRTIGISIKKPEYDENFYKFVSVLFRYQYTKKKTEFTPEIARTIYILSKRYKLPCDLLAEVIRQSSAVARKHKLYKA